MSEHMKCPKCGYHRQKGDENFVPASECPSCGIVYRKLMEDPAIPKAEKFEQTDTVLRPSPVDAESLKKARARVDKRINERMASKSQDNRRNQTLQLARRLASEGVRQRQEQWELREKEKQDQTTAQCPDEEADTSPTIEMDKNTEPLVEPDPPDAQPSSVEELADTITADQDLVEEMAELVQVAEQLAAEEAETANSSTAQQKTSLARAIKKQHAQPDGAEAPEAPETQPDETIDPSSILYLEEDYEGEVEDTWPGLVQEAAISEMDMPTAPLKAEMEAQPQAIEPTSETGSKQRPKHRQWLSGGRLNKLMPVVAWLILFAGIGGAVLSWTTLSEAEAGMQLQPLDGNNPISLGLLLGFAYLVTGVLGFAFFWVSSIISRQLKDIRQLLIMQPSATDQGNIETEAQASDEEDQRAEALSRT